MDLEYNEPTIRYVLTYVALGVIELMEIDFKAILPIPTGAEITACYLQDSALSFSERQAILQHSWSFTCTCPKCALSPALRHTSDRRLKEYRQIRDQYIGVENADIWQAVGRDETWRKIGRAIELLMQEDMQSEVADCWLSRHQASVRWGDARGAEEAGRRWLEEIGRAGDQVGRNDMKRLESFDKTPEWREFEAFEPGVSNHQTMFRIRRANGSERCRK